jgi:hypothetical protein
MKKAEELLMYLRKTREKIEIIEELMEEYLENPEQFNEDSLQKTVSFTCGFAIALLEEAEHCTHFRWTSEAGAHSLRRVTENEEESD